MEPNMVKAFGGMKVMLDAAMLLELQRRVSAAIIIIDCKQRSNMLADDPDAIVQPLETLKLTPQHVRSNVQSTHPDPHASVANISLVFLSYQ